jgi:hypothetical protein
MIDVGWGLLNFDTGILGEAGGLKKFMELNYMFTR